MNNKKDSDIMKLAEFELEEKHVVEVINTIKDEILKYVDKRKQFSDYLLDYRKKAIEEYKDDEDKIIEYFDHERFIKEEAYKSFDRKLIELTKLKVSPYFGSVEFKEDKYAPEKIYIGRFGLTREDEYEPIVVDWRAPIASLFYKGKTGRSSFEAPDGKIEADIIKRNQYVIKGGNLKGLFTSERDVKDEILQEILCSNTSEKLKDIIMSIQEEQDEIIRLPFTNSSIVDGVAGSGKTTIALHRIAYILYNFRKQLEDKVLIFGPNMIFMDYISNVLPELGETGVPQDTFHEFVRKALNLENVNSYDLFLSRIFHNDEEFIDDYKKKNSEEFKCELDNIMTNLENKLLATEDIVFKNKIVSSKEEINEMFLQYYKSMPLYRRSRKIRRILFNKITSIRNEIFYEIEKEYKKELEKLSDSERNILENNIALNRRMKIEELIRDVMKAKDELAYLKGDNVLKYYNQINNDKQLNHQDLAPILYLELKLNGIKYHKEIKHIVIDEAQDWGNLQLEVIKEYTKCNNFTIVGDCNQSMLPIDKENVLNNFENILYNNILKFKLNKSYRSTKEIMQYANELVGNNDIVPLVRSGEKVRIEEQVKIDELSHKVEEFFNKCKEIGYETTAVICNSISLSKEVKNKISNKFDVKLIDSEEVYLTKGNIIIPVCYGKGLEFDAVMMITEDSDTPKAQYVMATRALHDLTHLKL